jgi:hypothetical protein
VRERTAFTAIHPPAQSQHGCDEGPAPVPLRDPVGDAVGGGELCVELAHDVAARAVREDGGGVAQPRRQFQHHQPRDFGRAERGGEEVLPGEAEEPDRRRRRRARRPDAAVEQRELTEVVARGQPPQHDGVAIAVAGQRDRNLALDDQVKPVARVASLEDLLAGAEHALLERAGQRQAGLFGERAEQRHPREQLLLIAARRGHALTRPPNWEWGLHPKPDRFGKAAAC